MAGWLAGLVGRWGRGCPGADRLRPRRVVLLSCSWDGLCWSGGCWQGAKPLPAGEEGILPGPVGADLEEALAGVMREAGGDVPDPAAERVRVGFPQVRVVAEAHQARRRPQARAQVLREDPTPRDPPRDRPRPPAPPLPCRP